MSGFIIKPISDQYQEWIRNLLIEHWGATESVSRGRIHQADKLPGFIALVDSQPRGLVTYHIEGDQCEIVTLNSLIEKQGIGNALINSVINEAYAKGCKRLWLVTTNDNTHAFRFYQKRGLVVAGYHLNAIEQWRKLKPSIAWTGMDGIPIRDEIELELMLSNNS
jgi:ribosomal protein S18 acetylase RimI-like enzyme